MDLDSMEAKSGTQMKRQNGANRFFRALLGLLAGAVVFGIWMFFGVTLYVENWPGWYTYGGYGAVTVTALLVALK